MFPNQYVRKDPKVLCSPQLGPARNPCTLPPFYPDRQNFDKDFMSHLYHQQQFQPLESNFYPRKFQSKPEILTTAPTGTINNTPSESNLDLIHASLYSPSQYINYIVENISAEALNWPLTEFGHPIENSILAVSDKCASDARIIKIDKPNAITKCKKISSRPKSTKIRKIKEVKVNRHNLEPVKMIGPLCVALRREKVLRYLVKKVNRHVTKKSGFKYLSRSTRAEERLRYKGMFLSRPKARELLGIKNDKIISTEEIQQLLTNYATK